MTASPADLVRAGMEMIAWTYDPAEWEALLERRLDLLVARAQQAPPFPLSLVQDGRDPAAWSLLDRVRRERWTSVVITATGLLLESHRPGRHRLVEARPWRDEREPLRLVRLVSAGWDALCLEFGEVHAIAGVTPRLVVLPIPERLKGDIEQVAEILWRKTLEPGDDDASPPRWPDG